MLNPNDIAGKKFDKAMGRGYKSEEVDSFLNQVAGELGELAEEKKDLEKKLVILADRLEEYKNDEDSLRSALIGAQKLGDSVVRDAKARAETILEDANIKAAMMVENAKKEIERQQSGFVRMQREVATFKSKLQLVYKQHLELISSIPVDESIVKAAMARTEEAPPAAPFQAPQQEESAPEQAPIDEYDIPLPVDGGLSYREQPLEYEDEDYEPERPKRESRFGPLKFGKEFDIKREDDKRKK